MRDNGIADTGDLNRGPKGLKCWTAVSKHLVCWREVLQEPVSISFKRITVKNEALKFLTILLIGKTIAIHFRWSVFQYLFLLSLKLQFLMMMLKYFTFYDCSRIAHIRLLLKFLFKILVVLRITSNLYVVKTMWLRFLSGQLCLFHSIEFHIFELLNFQVALTFYFCACINSFIYAAYGKWLHGTYFSCTMLDSYFFDFSLKFLLGNVCLNSAVT